MPMLPLEQYAASLEAALHTLYDAQSRASSHDIALEILRINDAVRILADKYLSPLDPITDFKSTMLKFIDTTNSQGADA